MDNLRKSMFFDKEYNFQFSGEIKPIFNLE